MYMYDCIILDGLGCDVTIAMCNNKTLTPEKRKEEEKKKSPGEITRRESGWGAIPNVTLSSLALTSSALR